MALTQQQPPAHNVLVQKQCLNEMCSIWTLTPEQWAARLSPFLRNRSTKWVLHPHNAKGGFTDTYSHHQKQLKLHWTVQKWECTSKHCNTDEGFFNIAKRPHWVHRRSIALFQTTILVKAFHCDKLLFSFVAFKGNEPIKTQYQRSACSNEWPSRWIIKGHWLQGNENTTEISCEVLCQYQGVSDNTVTSISSATTASSEKHSFLHNVFCFFLIKISQGLLHNKAN